MSIPHLAGKELADPGYLVVGARDQGPGTPRFDVRLPPTLDQREHVAARRDRRIVTALIVALLGTAACFRLMRLSSVPGISGDEGWWGVQAIAWLGGRPYETRTTSGNPTDLFFLIPLGLVHSIAPPSFLLLRVLPALVNLLALPIGFWFARRLYGDTTAWIQTVSLAIAPTAIAHSRLCQDPSQSIFWTSIVIYLSLLGLSERTRAWNCLAAALLIFPVALWTHPTNVFIAPFLVLPFAAAIAPRLPASGLGRMVFGAAVALVAALAASIVWPALRYLAGSNPYLNKPWLSMVSARMLDPAQWLEYVVNYARLFNGVTIYHYFAGARPATVPLDAGFVAVGGAAAWGLLVRSGTRRHALDYGLIVAWASMGVMFYAFAGPESIRPHAERWGLCLMVPGTLVLARGVAVWIETLPRMRWLTIAAATLVATSVLASFYVNYFREFATTGGRSHPTYMTAAIEPKRQAFEQILARRSSRDRVMIVAQQWWHFWPIAYLAQGQTKVSVAMSLSAESQPQFQVALYNGQLFFVEFVGSPELTRAIDWIRERGLRSTTTAVQDASGQDLLEILHVTAAR
jgi:hypothetical protein